MTTMRFTREGADTALALRLIAGMTISEKDIETWSITKIRKAEDWAGAVHIHKTLPAVPVPPMPEFLTPYLPKNKATS